mgnify:CR=1 FL=1
MRTHTTRLTGVVAALVVLSAFAGCSALGGGSGSGCGPGDSKIENLEPGTTGVSVEGEVVETSQVSFAIDDGTGKAFIMPASGSHAVEEGDCVAIDGRAQSGGMGGPADISIIGQNVTSA